MSQTFAALKFPNFRIYFLGYLPSVAGTFMQSAALAWLVYELTKSNEAVSLVMAFLLVPTVLLMLPAGAVADRLDRRKILMVTQSALLVQSLLVWLLVVSGNLTAVTASIMCALAGICLAFEIPARMPVVCATVDEANIGNAVALNSFVFHSGITMGRALAAGALALGMVSGSFLVNAASFAVELYAISRLRGTFQSQKKRPSSTFQDTREGLVYFFKDPALRRVLVVTAVFGFFGMQFQPLAAGLAAGITGHTTGTIMAVFLATVGLGQAVGSLMLARKANKTYVARNLWMGYVLLSAATMALACSPSLTALVCSSAALGLAVPMCVSGGNAVIQTVADDHWRGRATGIYFTVFLGSEPLGYPIGGLIADHVSVTIALAIASVACMTAGIWYWTTNPVKAAATG